MKKYRLIINYPSLFQEHKKGDIVYYNSLTKNYVKAEAPHYSVSVYDVENYPDCWELIEEQDPLFITEDGVSIYTNNIELFAVNDMFETASSTHFDFDVSRKEGWKLFYHESNADEYIWRNKRVFSYKDIQNYGVHPVNMIRVEQLAKERIKG